MLSAITTDIAASMLTSIERILAWKLGLYHLNPAGTVKLVASSGSGTTSRYADGVSHSFRVISGHRDAGLTACPGNLLYAKLPTIRHPTSRHSVPFNWNTARNGTSRSVFAPTKLLHLSLVDTSMTA